MTTHQFRHFQVQPHFRRTRPPLGSDFQTAGALAGGERSTCQRLSRWFAAILLAIQPFNSAAEERPVIDRPLVAEFLEFSHLSLGGAVAAAQAEVSGGEPVSITIESSKRPHAFVVRLLVGGELVDVRIDIGCGEILGRDSVRAKDGELFRAAGLIENSRESLRDAIRIVETRFPNGRCCEARLAGGRKRPVIEVGMLLDDELRVIRVDASSGAILQPEYALQW